MRRAKQADSEFAHPAARCTSRARWLRGIEPTSGPPFSISGHMPHVERVARVRARPLLRPPLPRLDCGRGLLARPLLDRARPIAPDRPFFRTDLGRTRLVAYRPGARLWAGDLVRRAAAPEARPPGRYPRPGRGAGRARLLARARLFAVQPGHRLDRARPRLRRPSFSRPGRVEPGQRQPGGPLVPPPARLRARPDDAGLPALRRDPRALGPGADRHGRLAAKLALARLRHLDPAAGADPAALARPAGGRGSPPGRRRKGRRRRPGGGQRREPGRSAPHPRLLRHRGDALFPLDAADGAACGEHGHPRVPRA